MNTEQAQQQLLPISQEKLLAFVRTMIGRSRGREDDEHPLPPGPSIKGALPFSAIV